MCCKVARNSFLSLGLKLAAQIAGSARFWVPGISNVTFHRLGWLWSLSVIMRKCWLCDMHFSVCDVVCTLHCAYREQVSGDSFESECRRVVGSEKEMGMKEEMCSVSRKAVETLQRGLGWATGTATSR